MDSPRRGAFRRFGGVVGPWLARECEVTWQTEPRGVYDHHRGDFGLRGLRPLVTPPLLSKMTTNERGPAMSIENSASIKRSSSHNLSRLLLTIG